MRLGFVGAVEGSRDALATLAEHGASVARAWTLPPELGRRHSDYVDLGLLCEGNGIPLARVDNINHDAAIESIEREELDVLLIVGWSQLVGPRLLASTRHGVLGYHPTLLPDGRGRASGAWSILRGLRQTGGTLFFIDEGVDSGDIVAQEPFELAPDATARDFYDASKGALCRMMAWLAAIDRGEELPRRPQNDSAATYTAKRIRADGLIDWTWPAERIWTLIRATSEPMPGAFTYHRGQELIIWSADLVPEANYFGVPGQLLRKEPEGVLVATGDHFVRLRHVQPDGRQRLFANDYFERMHGRLGIRSLAPGHSRTGER